MTMLALAALILLALVNWHCARSFLYPPALFAGVWATYLFLLWCSGNLFFQLREDTVFFYACGAVAFSVGGLGGLALFRTLSRNSLRAPKEVSNGPRHRIRRVTDVLLLGLLIALPLYWNHVLGLAAQAKASDLWVAIRAEMIEAGESENSSQFRLADNLVVLSLIVALIVYYEDDGTRASRIRTYGAVGLAFVYTFMTATRASGIALILYLFALHLLKHGRISRRSLVTLSLLFVLVFTSLGILLNKGEARKDASALENVPAMMDGFLWYSLGGIIAFDTVFHSPTAVPPAQNVNRPFLMAANKFGAEYDIPSLHADYVVIGPGKEMNIYTFYFSYFPEFGTVGTMAILFLLGFGMTCVHAMAVRGNIQAVMLFAILFAGIVLSGYAENLILNINFILKTLVATWILYRWAYQGQPTLDLLPQNASC